MVFNGRKEKIMTREEAIQILSTRDAHGVLCGYTSGVTEAYDMAIEALSQPIVCKDYRIDDDHIYCSPKMADRVVEALTNEWTPITVSEPNTSDHVLVTYKWCDDDYETSELDYWVTKHEAENGNEKCKRLIDHVIAWRRMPDPYKEGE